MTRKRRHQKDKPLPLGTSPSAIVKKIAQYTVQGVGTVLDTIFVQGIKNYGRNYVCSSLEQIGGPIGAIAGWLRYRNYDTVNKFGPEVQKELLETFSMSYTGTVQPAIDILDKYEACFKKRDMKFDLFARIQTPGGDPLSAKLATATKGKDIIDRINAELKKPTPIATKLDDSRNDINDLNAVLKDPEAGQNPYALADLVQGLHSTAQTNLNNQLQEEQKNIETLFNDATFQQDLEDALGPGLTATQRDDIKQNMLTALKTEHDNVTKSVNDPKEIADLLDKMQKDAQKAADELFLISLLYTEGTEEMHKEINKLLNIRSPSLTLSMNGIDEEEEKKSLQGVTLDKIAQKGALKTLGGEALTDIGGGRYALTSLYGWDPRHQKPDQQMSARLMLLALALKAKGYQKVNIDINGGQSEKENMKIAKEAYEACRRIGYPKDKIVINIDNKAANNDELTNNTLEKQAAQWEKERNKNQDLGKQKATEKYQKQMRLIRSQGGPANGTPPPTPPVPPVGGGGPVPS